MFTTSDELKKKITEALRSHPEGLTIQNLAILLKVHRQTVTKYVLFLEGAGTIHRRRIGSATLHYLKEHYRSPATPARGGREK